jgi:hypothetical protein
MDDAKHTEQLSERELHAESSLKPGDKPDDTLNVRCGAIRTLSPDPSLISIDDSNSVLLGPRDPLGLPARRVRRLASRSPAPPPSVHGRLHLFWAKNKGLALVLAAQLFGTLMNVTTRVLEMEGNNGKWQVSISFRLC